MREGFFEIQLVTELDLLVGVRGKEPFRNHHVTDPMQIAETLAAFFAQNKGIASTIIFRNQETGAQMQLIKNPDGTISFLTQ
jgi:hypothetical protein